MSDATQGPQVRIGTVRELDAYFRSLYAFDEVAKADSAINGLQVGSLDAPVRRVAFAVDACLESFERAAAWKADVLVVHHGLFWGAQYPLVGAAYERIAFLCRSGLALYAMHLPLDRHPQTGNNVGLANLLGLSAVEPFGVYKGVAIGYQGSLPRPMSSEEVAARLFGEARSCLAVLPFGKKENVRVGLVSGGASDLVPQAIEAGLDLFVTGDADHSVYHHCLEAGINVIFGGHYQTETWGVALLSQRLEKEAGLETMFMDVPTGL